MVECMSVVVNVMLSLTSVMSPPTVLCNISVRTVVKYFLGYIGFLNCYDICMCVVNTQFESLEFVSISVYVDLKYNACVVCVVMWSSLACM